MRLFVVVQGDEIVVTSETGFRAEYWRRPNHPQLKVRRCTTPRTRSFSHKRGKRRTRRRVS
jgi:hypothetical protein